jgi:hypothetical protein
MVSSSSIQIRPGILTCRSFITTYDNRGTLKPGCNPSAHTIVYLKGTRPRYLPNEWENGMRKDPIAIQPTDPAEQMLPASRLRLGRVYSIECNVKVRDIGMVLAGDDRTKLLTYHREENDAGWEVEDASFQSHRNTYTTVAQPTHTAYANYNPYQQYTPQ